MTKAEIIENLIEQAETREWYAIHSHDSVSSEHAKVLRKAADLLQSAPEWISVKDRLPEEKEDVLVFIQVGIARKCEVAFLRNGKWEGSEVYLCASHVTHWMPLPVPPTENEEGAANA